ncbi:hypothetical protein M758_3G248000 [Ceratodon purpureus]|nr:hypothetical protein M758_3G248000 [Ceratodon purpureus]
MLLNFSITGLCARGVLKQSRNERKWWTRRWLIRS